MKTSARIILAVLLAASVLATVLTVGGCRRRQQADLVLVSPHSEYVQQEFERAFSAWHQRTYGTPVTLEWRDVGGTTQITNFLQSQYSGGGSAGIDIYFGGGSPDYVYLARQGLLEKITLPPEIVEALPDEIAGIRQYDADAGWYGACLSSFGIIYNAAVIERKNAGLPAGQQLPVPDDWADLADPRMYDQATAANAAKSGSARAAYETMLQAAGDWPAGWPMLLEFWGNCRRYTEGASDVPSLVGSGDVLAGTCIDYYAFNEMAVRQPGTVRYVVPQSGRAWTPDPIAVLRNPPHREMAQRFVEFVLSPEGQALWALPPGVPDGPAEHALYRQPIRPDVYERFEGRMLEELADPFAEEQAFRLDTELQGARISHVLGPLMQAAAIDNDQRLREAWKVVIDRGMPEDLVAEFARLPDNLATREALLTTAARLAEAKAANDARALDEITTGWRNFFREKYDRIVQGR